MVNAKFIIYLSYNPSNYHSLRILTVIIPKAQHDTPLIEGIPQRPQVYLTLTESHTYRYITIQKLTTTYKA